MKSTCRVLIADDDDCVGDLIVEALPKNWEKSVRHTVHSMMIALGAAVEEKRPYDIVLVDAKMPNGGLRDSIYMVRSLSPSSKLVVMSGYEDFIDEALTYGVEVIRKPFTGSQLMAVLNSGDDDKSTNSKASTPVRIGLLLSLDSKWSSLRAAIFAVVWGLWSLWHGDAVDTLACVYSINTQFISLSDILGVTALVIGVLIVVLALVVRSKLHHGLMLPLAFLWLFVAFMNLGGTMNTEVALLYFWVGVLTIYGYIRTSLVNSTGLM